MAEVILLRPLTGDIQPVPGLTYPEDRFRLGTFKPHAGDRAVCSDEDAKILENRGVVRRITPLSDGIVERIKARVTIPKVERVTEKQEPVETKPRRRRTRK